MNDEFLTRFRKPPRLEYATSLYQRISKPMPNQAKHPALKYTAMTLAMLLASALIGLASPSARTFAQSVLERVGGYGFSLGTPDTIDASQVPGPIRIVRQPESVSIEITGNNASTAQDPAEAGDLAGFSVLAPSYLPSGYSTSSAWFVITQDNGTVVTRDYHDADKNMLFINRWKAGDGELKVFTREQIEEVTVRGHHGVWLPETPSDHGNRALVWEENGITYSLIGDSLSLDEMLRIAESLDQ